MSVATARLTTSIALVALALALCGVAVAGYLALENLQGKTGVCFGTQGCQTVQDSRYGELLGVPVSVPGFLLYTGLVAASVAFLAGRLAGRPEVAFLAFLGTVAGVLMSAYLTYVEAFVLETWCSYCIVSALLMTGLLAAWTVLLWLAMREGDGNAGTAAGRSQRPSERPRTVS